MRPSIRNCIVLLATSILIAFGPPPLAASKDGKPPKTAGLEIRSWLVLGPAPYPLPVFHDAAEGGYDLKDLLKSEPLQVETLRPEQDRRVAWFSGDDDLRWASVGTGKRGEVGLAPLGGSAGERPAVAWLATYLSNRDWMEVEVEVLGRHPRRAWLDGEPVALGGTGEDDDVENDVALPPGHHLLVIQTVLDPERDARWSAGAELSWKQAEGRGGIAATLSPRREVTLRDVLDAPRIISVALAPDGERLATSFERFVPGEDEPEVWIEVRETIRGTVTESWPEDRGAGQVGWSPDGRYLSYVADVDDGAASLYLFDRESGRTFPLLDEVDDLDGYLWSPNGRVVLFATKVEAKEDKRGVKRLRGLMDRWSDFRDKSFLHLVTVPGGVRRSLTAGELTTEAAAFSPDGQRLLFTRTVEDLSRRPYSRVELWELRLEDATAKRLRDFRWLDGVAYSPDGGRLLVATQASEFGEAGLDVPPGTTANSYDTQLFIWEPASGDVEAVTRDFDPAVVSMVWSRRDGRIYLTAADQDFVRLYRYDPKFGTFATVETGFEVVRQLVLARSAPSAVAVGSSAWIGERLAAIDLRDGSARRLAHPADDRFADVGRGTVEPWSHTASSGRAVDGRVYLPPGFDPQGRYPAIVYYYGGTVPVDRRFGGRYPKEWWAANGYVVYVMQPAGAVGFGQAGSALHVNDWGKTASDEILEATRAFLEAHPYVDRERVGCIGASYGGFMTMLLATKTDLFAAAVAHAGISSIASYWGEGYWGYSYNSVAAAESFPWNRKDLYVDQSPLFRADRTQVPILLTHGRSDTNVPVGESDAFYVALKLLGKPVEYVQVEGQDHWIVDHEKRKVWSRTILAWFDRWLKGRPEWWDSLYPDSEGP